MIDALRIKYIFLFSLDPPRLPENLTRHKDVIENNPIVLLCPAAGTPTPLITWYKDDVLITGDQLGFVILEDGSLQVSDSEAADSGVYRCVAENDAGRVDHDVELKVLGKLLTQLKFIQLSPVVQNLTKSLSNMALKFVVTYGKYIDIFC